MQLVLQEKNLLKKQLLHKNKNDKYALKIALESKFFNQQLIQKTIPLIAPEQVTKIFIDAAIKINSPTIEEKKELLFIIKEYLSKLNIEQIENLANIIFQENLCPGNLDWTPHNQENLKNEYSSGVYGVKIFNSIDVKLIKLLYVAGGINLGKHKVFINSLASIKDTNEEGIFEAVILESNKKKILEIIKISDILSTFDERTLELPMTNIKIPHF